MNSEQGWSNPKIAAALDCGRVTVPAHVRTLTTRDALAQSNIKKLDRIYTRKLDGNAEAHLRRNREQSRERTTYTDVLERQTFSRSVNRSLVGATSM